jgi:hypothetical protein
MKIILAFIALAALAAAFFQGTSSSTPAESGTGGDAGGTAPPAGQNPDWTLAFPQYPTEWIIAIIRYFYSTYGREPTYQEMSSWLNTLNSSPGYIYGLITLT